MAFFSWRQAGKTRPIQVSAQSHGFWTIQTGPYPLGIPRQQVCQDPGLSEDDSDRSIRRDGLDQLSGARVEITDILDEY